MANDQADYYSGITSITVNGKNAYELKGKFLDDLHKNAFSGTNGEDASHWLEMHGDGLMELKDQSLDYWKLGNHEIEPTNDETSNLEETNHDNEQEIGEISRIETNLFDYETPLCEKFKEFNYLDPDVFTKDIEGFKTYDEYNDDWNKNVPWVNEKPWTDTGVWTEPAPVVQCCKPFNYKSGYSKWPTCSWREDGYCNGGNLPKAYIVGNMLRYQDLEWYEALKDSELKEEALRNTAIMEGLINDDMESNNEVWKSWDDFEMQTVDRNEWEYENEHEDEERYDLCDEEYLAVKEDEYEDSTSTSKDACRAYQEIFRMMDEGWMITILTTNTPYPSRKIQRICACTHQRPRREEDLIRRIQKKAIRRIQAI
ncbi:hypothetical protein Tco_0298776 [Tanacetum coccineum]